MVPRNRINSSTHAFILRVRYNVSRDRKRMRVVLPATPYNMQDI